MQSFGMTPEKSVTKKMIAEADANHDGLISQEGEKLTFFIALQARPNLLQSFAMSTGSGPFRTSLMPSKEYVCDNGCILFCIAQYHYS